MLISANAATLPGRHLTPAPRSRATRTVELSFRVLPRIVEEPCPYILVFESSNFISCQSLVSTVTLSTLHPVMSCLDAVESRSLPPFIVPGRLHTVRTCGRDIPRQGRVNSVTVHRVSDSGSVEVARLLVEHVADHTTAQDKDGLTPLHVASASGRPDIACFLVEQGRTQQPMTWTARIQFIGRWHAVVKRDRGCENVRQKRKG